MNVIRAVSFDPALANFGIARVIINLVTLQIGVEKTALITTEKRTTKVVRQNSDDLRRAQELQRAMVANCGACMIAFAEIPTGAQSARAMYAFGAAVGILASCPVPLIQVQPFETKLATVGTKTASKEEMIEWAYGLYPHLPWLHYEKATKNHAKGDLHDDNEHVADAIAVAHAGVRTDEFTRFIAMARAGMVHAAGPPSTAILAPLLNSSVVSQN
jgi:Holliday junction resolvasome RuvABC endonuclease subunit